MTGYAAVVPEDGDPSAVTPLRQQPCAGCAPGTPLVDEGELERQRAELDFAWRVEGSPRRLCRDVDTVDFASALTLATRIGLYAESVGHHPELRVGWGRLGVEIWSHAAGGITHSDLVFAAHVDAFVDDHA